MSRSTINSTVQKTSRTGLDTSAAIVFTELSANIFEHSQSYGYIAAQLHYRVFRLAVGDLGIGIFKSLQPYYLKDPEGFGQRFGPMWNEPKALDIAFVPGVSSKVARGRVGGMGLYSVLNIARRSNGVVICRTGRSKAFLGYQEGKWTSATKSNLPFFPGTQLEVHIPV